jgi:hypothetical protein
MSFVHSPKIITEGLVLALDAGNMKSYPGSGTTWFDKSGNARNGTLINGPTFSSANLGSIVFDGVNDYIDTTYTANTGNNFSFGVVCKPTSNGQSSGSDIMAKNYLPESPYISWGVDFLNDRTFRFMVADNTTFSFILSTPQTLNQVYYLFVTYQNKVITAYINGVVVGTKTNTNDPVYNDHTLTFGVWKEYPTDNYFVGNIYNAQIYNRALSASEIQQNFNALRGRYGI